MTNTTYDVALIGTHFLAQTLKKHLNSKGFSVALLEVFNHEENYFEFFYGLENTEEQKQALINFESTLDCTLIDSKCKLKVNILPHKEQKASPLWKAYEEDSQVLSLDAMMDWTTQQRALSKPDTFGLVQVKKENAENSFYKVQVSSEEKEITAKKLISLNSLQNLENFCNLAPELISFSKSLKPFLYTAVHLKLTHPKNTDLFKEDLEKKDLHIFQNKNFQHCVGRVKEGQSYWTCFIPYEDFEFNTDLSIKAIHYLKQKIQTICPQLLEITSKEKVIVETSLYSNKFFKGFSGKKNKLVLDSQNVINEACKKENKNLFFAISSKVYPSTSVPALWTSFQEASKLIIES
ncbi:MAG: hypothetical protein HAW63_05915 [Bdellovibrionaceae bacterium]|nr:hypothetical protein [Pseudobdellovibrionaceae bacterium]